MRYSRREWLNLPGHHQGAFILCELDDEGDSGGQFRYLFLLADCNGPVRFSIDVDSEAGRRNTLHKLDTLTRVLEEFRGQLEKYHADHPVDVEQEAG